VLDSITFAFHFTVTGQRAASGASKLAHLLQLCARTGVCARESTHRLMIRICTSAWSRFEFVCVDKARLEDGAVMVLVVCVCQTLSTTSGCCR
jgi:hypothetical protein